MATVKVKTDGLSKRLKQSFLKDVFTESYRTEMGEMLVEEVNKFVANGISPVEGEGRYAAYKNPKTYPGDLKRARPVNLYLTGNMLAYLSFRGEGSIVKFGFIGMSEKVAKKVETHNDGKHPHVPKRQIIPGPGQKFIVSIQRKIVSVFRKRVAKLIANMNRKK